jgi:hypothetical protein
MYMIEQNTRETGILIISVYKKAVREVYTRPVVWPATLRLNLFLARFPVSNNWLFVDIFETGTELEGGRSEVSRQWSMLSCACKEREFFLKDPTVLFAPYRHNNYGLLAKAAKIILCEEGSYRCISGTCVKRIIFVSFRCNNTIL